MIGVFLGIIGAEARKDQQSQQLMEALKTCNTTKNNRNLSADREPQFESNSGGSSNNTSSSESLGQVILDIVYLELPVVGVLLLVALWVGWMEGWGMVGSLYWLVVTGTTVGFGDYYPTMPSTRLFCIFFLPIAVAVQGKLLARIASAYMDRKVKRKEKEFLSRSLALCDLQVMDTDVNGKVDLAEFLTYMLVALQKVSTDDIREIRDVFHKLDVDKNGVLTIADLKNPSVGHDHEGFDEEHVRWLRLTTNIAGLRPRRLCLFVNNVHRQQETQENNAGEKKLFSTSSGVDLIHLVVKKVRLTHSDMGYVKLREIV
jgi:Ion channel